MAGPATAHWETSHWSASTPSLLKHHGKTTVFIRFVVEVGVIGLCTALYGSFRYELQHSLDTLHHSLRFTTNQNYTVCRLGTTLLKQLDAGLCVLTQLLDLGSLHSNDRTGQALVDQQTELTVKIHPIVLLVLFQRWNNLQQDFSNSFNVCTDAQDGLYAGL